MAAGCGLVTGNSYCIEQSFGASSPSIVTTTSAARAGDATPSPIQSGMTQGCVKFQLAKAGDTCDRIAKAAGIRTDQFFAWNPDVGPNCGFLLAGFEYCVGVIGATATIITTTIGIAAATTTATNGIVTPTPAQDGMVDNCNEFYLVQKGDTCAKVASKKHVSLDHFYRWNPSVGTDCSLLELGAYVCVGTLDGNAGVTAPTTAATNPPPTTTVSGNGVATPTPFQDDIPSDCNKFHLGMSPYLQLNYDSRLLPSLTKSCTIQSSRETAATKSLAMPRYRLTRSTSGTPEWEATVARSSLDTTAVSVLWAESIKPRVWLRPFYEPRLAYVFSDESTG